MRRTLIALMLLAVLSPAFAQSPERVYRLGYLSPGFADNAFRAIQSVAAELAHFGFVEGKNLLIDARYAEGTAGRLPELAREIAHSRPDVIIAATVPAIRAAKDAAPSTPIVMAFAGEDPVVAGLVTSLARPGGNVTGIALLAAELDAKRVELTAQALPGARARRRP
jgi:putative ABC transport system substrate-binding protein